MRDDVMREMINVQTATIMALRGIVTVQLSGEDVTEEAVFEVIEPLMNPGANLKTKREFQNIIRGLVGDVLTTAKLREARSKDKK